MEEILKNVQDPSWWFTGIFFLLVGILISKLIKKWLPAFFGYLSEKLPFLARGLYRKIQLKRLRKIKYARFDDVLVIREVVKNYIYLVLFLLPMFILFSAFFGISIDIELNTEVLKEKKQEFFAFMLLLSIPTYIFEWLYLRQNAFLKRLLKSRDRIRIRGIGRGFYPLPPTPPGVRVRTGRLPRTSDRSQTSQPKG